MHVRLYSVAVFLLSLIFFGNPQALAQEGITPLAPPQSLSGALHTHPDPSSPAFREIKPSDQVKVLRNSGEWFEVDIVSAEGIEFRGWVLGGLPEPLRTPEKQPETLRPAKDSPLDSQKFFWFWSGDIEEKAELRLHFGGELLTFDPSGTPLGDVADVSGYQFTGLSLGGDLSLTLLETQLAQKEFRWLLDSEYRWGFFQVSFGNSVNIPEEIQGASYRIQTQRLFVGSKAEWRLARWDRGFLRTRLGFGYLSFVDSPDLKRTPEGNVVFTEFGVSGLAVPLEAQIQMANSYRLTLSAAPVLIASVTEKPDASTTGDLKLSGTIPPLWIQTLFQYRFSQPLSIQGTAEYFTASAKHPGVSRRIDENFQDVKINLSSLRLTAGIGVHF